MFNTEELLKTFNEYLFDSEATLWPLDSLNILIFILVIDMKASSSVMKWEVVGNRAAPTAIHVLTHHQLERNPEFNMRTQDPLKGIGYFQIDFPPTL